MSVNAIEAINSSMLYQDISPTEGKLVSLEDRMTNAYADAATRLGQEKETILKRLDNPSLLSNPANLLDMQVRTSNYNLEVSMISTLSRKAVGAVESLLRS